MKHIWRISLIVVVLVFILSIQTGVAGAEDKDIIMPSIEEETECIVMLEFSESDSPENIELNKLKSTLLLRIDKLIEENKEKTQAEVAEISNSDVLVESAEK